MNYKCSQNITFGPKGIQKNYHDQGLIPVIELDKRVKKINFFQMNYKRMPIDLPGIYLNKKDKIKSTNKMTYVVSHILNYNARQIIAFSTNIGQEPLQKNHCQNEGANS